MLELPASTQKSCAAVLSAGIYRFKHSTKTLTHVKGLDKPVKEHFQVVKHKVQNEGGPCTWGIDLDDTYLNDSTCIPLCYYCQGVYLSVG